MNSLQRVEAALARAESFGNAKGRDGEIIPRQSSAVERVIRQILTSLRLCSVHGSFYRAEYQLQPGGLYTLNGCYAITPVAMRNVGNDKEPTEFQIGQSGVRERCPWCQTEARRISGLSDTSLVPCVKCGGCHRWVCLGATIGTVFTCFCGNSGRISDESTAMSGTEQKSIKPLVTGGQLRLTSGK